MIVPDGVRASALLFVTVLIQAVVIPPYVLSGGSPEVLLLVVISLRLLRGSVAGAD